MKLYVFITGVIFGLIVVAHVLRVMLESTSVAKDPWFLLTTALSIAMCYWAWRLLRRPAGP
jgi:hypothetical protein